jgi:tetratricopeptide (TPR) repeat protein
VDTYGLYGSDGAAAKAAKAELNGLINYFEAGINDVSLPLMALVDTLGHRLIAMSVLPIAGDSSLIYGSSDGGVTVRNDSIIFSERMAQAACRLNLKPHLAGIMSSSRRVLWSAADIEGHRGSDDRLYLLDLARAFPPEAPVQFLPRECRDLMRVRLDAIDSEEERRKRARNVANARHRKMLRRRQRRRRRRRQQRCNGNGVSSDGGDSGDDDDNNDDAQLDFRLFRDSDRYAMRKNTHLFEMLRPELVHDWRAPLCSDAFSGFILQDPRMNEHNRQVVEATEHLLKVCVPRCAKDLRWAVAEAAGQSMVTDVKIVEFLHRRGVNLRHMGLVLARVPTGNSVDAENCARLLLIEAVSRIIKRDIRRLLRDKLRQLSHPSEVPFRRVVVKHLNLVFGSGERSRRYWHDTMPRQLASKYAIDAASIITLRTFSCLYSAAAGNGAAGARFQFPSFDALLLRKICLAPFMQGTCSGRTLLYQRLASSLGLVYGSQLRSRIVQFQNAWWPTMCSSAVAASSSSSSAKRSCHSESLSPTELAARHSIGLSTSSDSTLSLGDYYDDDDDDGDDDDNARHRERFNFGDHGSREGGGDDDEHCVTVTDRFDLLDIAAVDTKVSFMNIVANAQASVYRLRAGVPGCSRRLSISFYRRAIEQYESALQSTPNSPSILRQLAKTRLRLLELIYPLFDSPTFPAQESSVIQADHCFLRALDANSRTASGTTTARSHATPASTRASAFLGIHSTLLLGEYAQFLFRCGRFARAEEFFLRTLESDPNNAKNVTMYARFLRATSQRQDALRFEQHADNLRRPAATATTNDRSSPSPLSMSLPPAPTPAADANSDADANDDNGGDGDGDQKKRSQSSEAKPLAATPEADSLVPLATVAPLRSLSMAEVSIRALGASAFNDAMSLSSSSPSDAFDADYSSGVHRRTWFEALFASRSAGKQLAAELRASSAGSRIFAASAIAESPSSAASSSSAAADQWMLMRKIAGAASVNVFRRRRDDASKRVTLCVHSEMRCAEDKLVTYIVHSTKWKMWAPVTKTVMLERLDSQTQMVHFEFKCRSSAQQQSSVSFDLVGLLHYHRNEDDNTIRITMASAEHPRTPPHADRHRLKINAVKFIIETLPTGFSFSGRPRVKLIAIVDISLPTASRHLVRAVEAMLPRTIASLRSIISEQAFAHFATAGF